MNKTDLAPTARRWPSTSRPRPPSSASSTPTSRCRRCTGDGVDALIGELETRLPEGPQYYPDGVVTDQPETFLAAELLREQLLRVAREELPHSITVVAEEIEPETGGSARSRRTDVPATDPAPAGADPRRAGFAEGHRDRQGRRGAQRGGTRRAKSSRRCSGPASTSRPRCKVRARLAAPRALPSIASDSEFRQCVRDKLLTREAAPMLECRATGTAATPWAALRGRENVAKETGRDMTLTQRPSVDASPLAVAVLVLVSARARRLQRRPRTTGRTRSSPRARPRRQIDDLFMPVLIIAIVVGIFDHRRHGLRRASSSATVRAEREPEAGARQHPPRDRLDDRPRADPRRSSRCPRVATIFDLAEDPGPEALQVTVVGKQWWWRVPLPRRQGRHRRRADHPDRPRVVPEAHRVRRVGPTTAT